MFTRLMRFLPGVPSRTASPAIRHNRTTLRISTCLATKLYTAYTAGHVPKGMRFAHVPVASERHNGPFLVS